MSYPANPLDGYQSYSYQHFLLAANNTEVLRQIEAHEISFESLALLKHGETVANANTDATNVSGTCVMVINSAVDSKYFIDAINYTNLFINVQNSTERMTQASTLEMTVKETGGTTFINFLRTISDEILQTSYNSVAFMLKTFFVGHRANGTTDVYQTEPITILMKDMNSQFDFSGGTHQISFLGQSNGAPLKISNLHYVNRNLNLMTNDNSVLLKDLIEDLERKLNAQLEDQWKLVQGSTNGNGRKVKYKFTIPAEWATYKVKSTNKDNYIERLFDKEKQAVAADQAAAKNQAAQKTPGIENDRYKTSINTSVRTTVTQILSEIFKHCDEISAAFADNQKLDSTNQQTAKLHQVVSSITSDNQTMTVHFDTVIYYLPRLKTTEETEIAKKITEDNLDKIKDQQFDEYGITFDYIFTGMNSDILAMDLKANHTNALLLINQAGVQAATGNMTATDKSVKTASSDPKQVKQQGQETMSVQQIRKYDAVFLPELPTEAQHGFIYAAPDSAKLRMRYQNFLAQIAATSTQNVHINIRGNPIFMSQMVLPLLPHNDTDYEKAIVDRAAQAKSIAELQNKEFNALQSVCAFGKSSSHLPQLCKINIKTPIFDSKGNVTGYEPFWYQGRYRITEIRNRFSAGTFEQELYLLPYDVQGLTQT